MTYRFYNPAPVLHDLLGIEPCALGTLHFYDQGTTNPRTTWADADQAVPNPNPVPLDSSGRANNNIWLDGAYSVALKDADGITVWTRDVDSGAGAGQAIPALVNGQFLTNDGVNLIWAPILEVPDPTGSEGYQLEVASGIPTWVPKPEPPPPPESDIGVQVGAAGYQWTNGLLIQWGSDSAPASGDKSTTKAASFPISFDEAPYHIGLTPKLGTITQNGSLVCATYTSPASGGFTANFGLADDDNKSWKAINVTVPFTWMAIGKKTTRPNG